MVIRDNLLANRPDQDLELACRALLGGSKSHANTTRILYSVKVLKWFILKVAFNLNLGLMNFKRVKKVKSKKKKKKKKNEKGKKCCERIAGISIPFRSHATSSLISIININLLHY